MRISLSPQRRDDTLEVSRNGDTLTINGDPFDFSDLLDGEAIEADALPSDWLAAVVRKGGTLNVTLILPHGPNPSRRVAFPDDITYPPSGPIALPHDPAPEPGE